MGNRAVIELEGNPGIGIYLHWNGGRASVEAFLKAAKDLQIRADDYGTARLAQIIGNWFGGTCSIGVGKLSRLDTDNGDNGTYKVKDWEIVGRSPEGYGADDEIDPQKTAAIYREVMKVNAPIFEKS